MAIGKHNYIGIGYFLKSRRESLNITRESLAKSMCITIETLEEWENENLDNMELKDIRKLAFLLKYCPSIFIEGVPKRAYKDWDSFINEKNIKC